MSVVSSDDAPVPLPSPLPLSSLFLTHWPCTCSLFLLPITRSSVLCASCYMSMSLVIKNALWLSHVLVYWIKENPNIIVINTNNITIQCWHGGRWLTRQNQPGPPNWHGRAGEAAGAADAGLVNSVGFSNWVNGGLFTQWLTSYPPPLA